MASGRNFKHVDPEQVRQLSGRGYSQKEIAACLGIGYRTLQKRIAENPDVREALENGKADLGVRLIDVVVNQALSGDLSACQFLLRNRYGFTPAAQIDVNHTHEAGPTLRLILQGVPGTPGVESGNSLQIIDGSAVSVDDDDDEGLALKLNE